MKKRFSAILLAISLLLYISGCSLAQPERTDGNDSKDRFIGFYMVYKDGLESSFDENEYLTEYGEVTVDLGKFGDHAFPRQVLFAEDDGNFPGLSGYALYVLDVEESWGISSHMYSDMADSRNAVNSTDQGNDYSLSGVIYMGSPMEAPEDWNSEQIGIWIAYRVYQTPDGRAYIDGSGSSFNGAGAYSEEESHTTTIDGETQTNSVCVSVEVKSVPRLNSVAVLQYGDEGELLERTTVPLIDDPPPIKWLSDAAWAVVEEHSADGVQRAAYDRPGADSEQISHQLILLDSQGLGRATSVTLE